MQKGTKNSWHLKENLYYCFNHKFDINVENTQGISPSFVTVPVKFFAVELRLLTMLSMAASCFKKNGRITRVYKILEPFHDTGAIHQIRNTHWKESRRNISQGAAVINKMITTWWHRRTYCLQLQDKSTRGHCCKNNHIEAFSNISKYPIKQQQPLDEKLTIPC